MSAASMYRLLLQILVRLKDNYCAFKRTGYAYTKVTDKWNISDAAADYIFTAHHCWILHCQAH
jgi:hypothetical protein